jgi:hypothetical protein
MPNADKNGQRLRHQLREMTNVNGILVKISDAELQLQELTSHS